MRRFAVFVAVLLSAWMAVDAKEKPGKGKGKGQGQRREEVQGFLPRDRSIIVEYFRSPPSGLPPGLAKRGGDLPPGLEKQLRRKGQLPPGLEKGLTPFPPELVTRLAPLPGGYQHGIVGHLAIVWDSRTRVIVDVMALEGR